jgi:hypothetical protein
MKIFIAYALVAARIPNYVGMVLAIILNLPVTLTVRFSRRGQETVEEANAAKIREPKEWLCRGKLTMAYRDRIAHACHDIFSGLGSVLAAAVLFHFLQQSLTIWVLVIMVFWEIIFMVFNNQSLRALFCSISGLLIGWVIVWQVGALG